MTVEQSAPLATEVAAPSMRDKATAALNSVEVKKSKGFLSTQALMVSLGMDEADADLTLSTAFNASKYGEAIEEARLIARADTATARKELLTVLATAVAAPAETPREKEAKGKLWRAIKKVGRPLIN